MLLRLYITLILIGFACAGWPQEAPLNNKFNSRMKLLLAGRDEASPFVRKTGQQQYVDVLLELAPNASVTALKEQGALIHTVAGTIVTAQLPLHRIDNIAALPEILRIELPQLVHRTDDKMKAATRTTQVHEGLAPLSRAYKGKDIVIGIIDDGIDITHPDFYTADSNSRIQFLWNMDHDRGQPPAGFHYGYEWTSDSLERYAAWYRQKKFSIYEMQRMFGYGGHGTPVTGLAAGKNGVAPEAGIIAVALTAFKDTLLYSNRIIDAISYIQQKAATMGKKCVVNISLGVNEGAPHDGSSLVEKAIDNLCANNPYLLVCVSAGNYGNTWKHWGGFPIHADSSFSFFQCGYEGTLSFYIPRQFRDSVSISIAESHYSSLNAPAIQRDSIFFQTPYLAIAELVNSGQPRIIQSKTGTGQLESTLTFTASPFNTEYDELLLYVNAPSPDNSYDPHLYRFIFKGKGWVHAWFPFANLHPVFYFERNPFPNDPTFRLTDNDYTTTIPSNAREVLSVGAYNIRSCYINIKKDVVTQYNPGALAFFTSHGPTLDGRIKPDLIAPGDNVMTSRSRMENFYDHYFIVDTNTVAFGGTSAASPIVAGAAALLWERFPEFTANDIKQLLKDNTFKDWFTEQPGPTPNNIAGQGKLDLFKAMTGVALPDSINLTTDTCNVPVVNNPPPPPTQFYWKVYPNPVKHDFCIVEYFSAQPLSLLIYDALGRLHVKRTLPASGGISNTILPVSGLAGGLYYLHISNPAVNESKKLVIVR